MSFMFSLFPMHLLEHANTARYRHGKDHKLCLWKYGAGEEELLNKTLPLDIARPGAAGNIPTLVCSLAVNALNFCAFSLLFLEGLEIPSSDDSRWFDTESETTDNPPEYSSGEGEEDSDLDRVASQAMESLDHTNHFQHLEGAPSNENQEDPHLPRVASQAMESPFEQTNYFEHLETAASQRPNLQRGADQPTKPFSGYSSDESEDIQEGEYESLTGSWLENLKGANQREEDTTDSETESEETTTTSEHQTINVPTPPTLIAVPNTLDSGGIDFYCLQLSRRVSTIPSETQTGMLMAIEIFLSTAGELYAATGFEDGHIMLYVCRDDFRDVVAMQSCNWRWDKIYSHKSHKQPVLSIALSPAKDYFISSAADSLLVKHPIPTPSPTGSSLLGAAKYSPLLVEKMGHMGQQGLRIRSDNLIFAAACWDRAFRVYRCQTINTMSTYNWHREGCNAVAFGEIDNNPGHDTDPPPYETNPAFPTHRPNTLGAMLQQRAEKVQKTHWLAVGSKGGQISLWEMY